MYFWDVGLFVLMLAVSFSIALISFWLAIVLRSKAAYYNTLTEKIENSSSLESITIKNALSVSQEGN